MSANLKPCPFCGYDKPKVNHTSKRVGENGLDDPVYQHTYSVRCPKCYARGCTVGGKVLPRKYRGLEGLKLPLPSWATTDEVLEEFAIVSWNHRSMK